MSEANDQPPLEFNQIVNDYYQPLYRFGYSLAGNESDAADLTQQTFMIWAEKGSSLRDKSKVKSWLFTTLYREFLRVRRRGKNMTTQEEEILEAVAPTVEPDLVNPLDASAAVALLQEIDEIYRAPLTLFYLEDMAYKEISEQLDVPIGTVMSRLSRGKAALKKLLLDRARDGELLG